MATTACRRPPPRRGRRRSPVRPSRRAAGRRRRRGPGGERGRVAVAGVEGDGIAHVQVVRAGPQAGSDTPRRLVRAPSGWVWPATTYRGAGWRSRSCAIASMPHSMPLPGPMRPQVRTVGAGSSSRLSPGARLGDVGGAVRDQPDLVWSMAIAGGRAGPCGLVMVTTTSASRARARRGPPSGARVGVRQHGVEHDDDRAGVAVRTQDLVAVPAAEDAVLVLDDDDVEAVEPGGRRLSPDPPARGPTGISPRVVLARPPRRRRPRRRRRRPWRSLRLGVERGAEGGKPAQGGWIGADESVGRHMVVPPRSVRRRFATCRGRSYCGRECDAIVRRGYPRMRDRSGSIPRHGSRQGLLQPRHTVASTVTPGPDAQERGGHPANER